MLIESMPCSPHTALTDEKASAVVWNSPAPRITQHAHPVRPLCGRSERALHGTPLGPIAIYIYV